METGPTIPETSARSWIARFEGLVVKHLQSQGVETEDTDAVRTSLTPDFWMGKEGGFWNKLSFGKLKDNPEETQRRTCSLLVEEISRLGEDHETVASLRAFLGVSEKQPLAAEDLADITAGRPTRMQKAEAAEQKRVDAVARQKREQAARQAEVADRRKQEAEERRLARDRQRAQAAAERRRETEERKRQKQEGAVGQQAD